MKNVCQALEEQGAEHRHSRSSVTDFSSYLDHKSVTLLAILHNMQAESNSRASQTSQEAPFPNKPSTGLNGQTRIYNRDVSRWLEALALASPIAFCLTNRNKHAL